ncbi:aldolase/citrate lyase family protein [Cellulomonas sp. RIT-PI-Y]|uniref:HpcH/HpaI aldolase family protein n=1 Tax=Cellulomonas sp. RIT-PI-Y TaxID=3035297 RepID=UPI0021DA001C|nr:aldolase/citrate lyase family protein [Cellulomonas sp. RIT-PI-Y]
MILHTASPALGLWSSLADTAALRLLAAADPDWLVLDAQHGLWSDATIAAALPVLGSPAWVRVQDDRPAGIGRALDAGAAGVIVPMVESAEQAAAVVAAVHYPPRGRRSWGPAASLVGRPVVPAAEADPACAVMVETEPALARVAEIAATPGLDMIFLGPFDLALALGRPLDALLDDGGPLRAVVTACHAHGLRAGAFAGDPVRGARLIELGFTEVVVGTDAGLLAAGARAALGDATGAGRGGY